MTEEKMRQGHCPKCGPDRFSDIVAEFKESFSDKFTGFWSAADYRILRCRGCGSIYYQRATAFSEDIDEQRNEATGEWEQYHPESVTHWPAPTKRTEPEWAITLRSAHRHLSNLLDDVYGCLNADLLIPAAIATRTTFDAASEMLSVDPASSFADKLKALQAKGHIGGSEREALGMLTDAANAAAHRGWKPSLEQLDTIVSVLEGFLRELYTCVTH